MKRSEYPVTEEVADEVLPQKRLRLHNEEQTTLQHDDDDSPAAAAVDTAGSYTWLKRKIDGSTTADTVPTDEDEPPLKRVMIEDVGNNGSSTSTSAAAATTTASTSHPDLKRRYCETCDMFTTKSNWAHHVKTAKHLSKAQPVKPVQQNTDEEPPPLKRAMIKEDVGNNGSSTSNSAAASTSHPDLKRRYCETCDMFMTKSNWAHHVKTARHLSKAQPVKPVQQNTDEGNSVGETKTRYCELCDTVVSGTNWSHHVKTARHTLKTIQPVQPKPPGPSTSNYSSMEPRAGPSSAPPTFVRSQPGLSPAVNRPALQTPRLTTTRRSKYLNNYRDTTTTTTQRTNATPETKPRRSARLSTIDQPERPSLKTPCPICGRPVLVRGMKKHQTSKRCLNSFEIIQTRSRHIKKYQTTEIDYTIKVNVLVQMEAAINRMIEMAKEKGFYRQGGKISIVAGHKHFHHDVSTIFDSWDEGSSAREFLDHLSRIISSNEEINMSNMKWNVKVINIPSGQSNSRRIFNLSRDVRTKKCITRIRNTDNLCGPRAVVTALTYHTDDILGRPISTNEKKLIRMGRPLQTELATELCARLADGYNEEGFTLDDFAHVERLLGVQIKIVCAENLNALIYEGDSQSDTVLYLYKNGNHFDVINSMRGFFASSYYCFKCDTAYNNKKRRHRCKTQKICEMCSRAAHGVRLPTVYCADCNRYCYNADCLANHGPVCEEKYKCRTCRRIKTRKEPHNCKYYLCRTCHAIVEDGHRCYMTVRRPKGGKCGYRDCPCSPDGEIAERPTHVKTPPCTYTENYLFFDYEANQETGVHEANFIHVQDFNGDSWDFEDNRSFCEWLISDDHSGYTCIAHNAKGYDSHFILRYCVENAIKPYTIYTGSKLMMLEIRTLKLRVIDSVNFVASPLSAFPKTFGLRELKKGYFPHYFNTAANQTYVGPLPDVEYYGADDMRADAREAFLKWHAERRAENYVFDFRRELEEYCKSDVDILRRGCLELRKEFLEIANIDPFCYITIASVCMAVYRSMYLPADTVAVLPAVGQETYSKESITWLATFEGVNIEHALNGGERRICGASVDGYCEETNTVYQFHGCYWHGCVKCYEPSTINRRTRDSMGDLYNMTTERTRQLREAGYTVVEMWECDWSPQYRRLPVKPPVLEADLNPRDAFFGGRTNACKLRVVGKKMRYIDVVSLYPTVMFYDKYPVGHPVKIKNPERYNPHWFGFVRCKVLAPRGLYHPVLPVKGKKLMFPLCRRCAIEKCVRCEHGVDERALTGTWTTVEVNKAIQKGYKILRVYDVWHFQQTTDTLFRGYIENFMKIKLETSPWEKDFSTLDDYVRCVRQQVGIELDPSRITSNPGKRAVAKICLNSLWGKFGQRTNMKETAFVTDTLEFYKILLNDRLDKINLTFLNDNVVQMTFNRKRDCMEDSPNTNMFVAAYTTAHARLRLYDMMDRLGESVVYYDTDSIVYIDNGDNTVPTGCMLGEWCDELGTEDHMNDWVSTGPKSYAYETALRKGKCKIKGFTLNYKNSMALNIDTLKSLVRCESEIAQIKYNQITRDNFMKKIINKTVSKTFRLDYDKRRLLPTYEDGTVDTLPWGY